MVQFHILGPVEVWSGEQRVDLGKAESAKARCVLAALLRDTGELVTSEVLAGRVWGDNQPGPAVRYKYVGWLRAALAPYGVPLIFRDNGYVIQVDPDQVDLHRFRRLVSDARSASGAGRHEDAAAAVGDALALWHGPALAGLSGRWPDLFREQLAEERVGAITLRARAQLELGRYTEVVTELAELHTERPADETIAGLLMLALYRSGQRSQALAQYRSTEQHIRDTLDTEPGPELQDLRRRIQAGDRSILAGQLVIGPAGPAPADVPEEKQRPVRVVVAEDSAILRDSLVWLLRTRGHDVAAAVPDAKGLSAAVAEHQPDVVVVDVRLPPTHTDEGLRAAVTLRRDHPGLAVMIFSPYVETRFAAGLLADQAGGVGYLLKDRAADVGEFIDALTRVAGGGTALDPEVVSRLVSATGHRHELDALTSSDRKVLALMAEGRPSASIGRTLAIPASAVDEQVTGIFGKLGLSPSADGNRRVLALLRYLLTLRSETRTQAVRAIPKWGRSAAGRR
jgi:DNA-binding NarL/FixJ family response regulator/DNA-binding SARP family transcriptional activator